MLYLNELKFIKEIFEKKHINSYILYASDIDKIKIANNLYRNMFSGEQIKSFEMQFNDIEDNIVYKISDTFYCKYIFLKLPNEENSIFLIGPYTLQNFSHDDLIEISERFSFTPDRIKELEYHLAAVPHVIDESYIFSILNTFCEHIWGGNENFVLKDVSNEIFSLSINNLSYEYKEPISFETDIKIMEERYRYENEIIDAVKNGYSHKAELILSTFTSLSFENRTADQLRNMKNYCIITNTLFRKAAENGGVHPYYLNSVSSEIAKKIELISSVGDVPKFILKIFKTYCKLVKDNKTENFSPLVEKVIILVDSDLTANLNLESIAKRCSVSSGYLSATFKKETGQTITDFVNLRRIEYAKKLLKTTNLQIQTIAQHCGILDIAYFSKLFKKYEGVSPKQYRID